VIRAPSPAWSAPAPSVPASWSSRRGRADVDRAARRQAYIVANFKETQVSRLRIGQPVEIKADAFGKQKIVGKVDSFAPATGQEFALIPVENAVGNFTKITQRLPVKIVVDRAKLGAALRPGLSVDVKVDVRDRSGASFAEAGRPPRSPDSRRAAAKRAPRHDRRRPPRPSGGGPAAAVARDRLDQAAPRLRGMVIGQFMAILDIQIVAASLPQIQAGVGASADQISWIQTAYLIPEVVMIPLSGICRGCGARSALYLISCTGFIVMSVLTGLSSSIDMMILTRALQGFIGGAMIPTVFAVAFTAFPPERRITASVIMGLIVTLAPTVGPTLGGHLTEWLSWRWLFFINVPTGLIVLFGVYRWGRVRQGRPQPGQGLRLVRPGVMATFLMSMQFVLEEGAKNDWFDDSQILALAVLAVIAGGVFIWRQLTYRNPIVELRAFANRNFTVGVAMTAVSGASLFGGTFLLPQFLGRVRHYSASEVGTTMVVSGLSMFHRSARRPSGAQVRPAHPDVHRLHSGRLGHVHGPRRDQGLGFLGIRGRSGLPRRRGHDRHDRDPADHDEHPAPAHGQERLRPGEPVAQHRRRHRPGLAGHLDHPADGAVL
jgi:MFS family permease